jgi:hypothetical protein
LRSIERLSLNAIDWHQVRELDVVGVSGVAGQDKLYNTRSSPPFWTKCSNLSAVPVGLFCPISHF